jgi:DNA-binding HxlR family transcriptional regulator
MSFKKMKNNCLILEYYYFLGKKWSYPLLFHMQPNKDYSFDDFIFISNRRISRSVLILFLKQAIELHMIRKKDKKYKLTKLGLQFKEEFIRIKSIILLDNKNACDFCYEKSLVNLGRVNKIKF